MTWRACAQTRCASPSGAPHPSQQLGQVIDDLIGRGRHRQPLNPWHRAACPPACLASRSALPSQRGLPLAAAVLRQGHTTGASPSCPSSVPTVVPARRSETRARRPPRAVPVLDTETLVLGDEVLVRGLRLRGVSHVAQSNNFGNKTRASTTPKTRWSHESFETSKKSKKRNGVARRRQDGLRIPVYKCRLMNAGLRGPLSPWRVAEWPSFPA